MEERQRRRLAWGLVVLLIMALLLWFLLEDGDKPVEQDLASDPDPVAPRPEDPAPRKPDPKPEPRPTPEKTPPPAPRPPIPTLPERFGKAKDLCDLIEAARLYLDLAAEQWRGRTKLMAALEEHAAEGRWFLKDMRALRWLVYQGRSFEPPWSDRKWQKAVGIGRAKALGGTLRHIASDDLRATYSVPKPHAKPKALKQDCPRQTPFPLLVALHDTEDALGGARYPGADAVARRYPKESWEALYARWFVLAPESETGRFLGPQGRVREDVLKNPLADFWRHYHVDFERFVLDGTQDAFTVATSMPVFFAGVVFRGAWMLETEDQRALIRNLGPLPIYVVDNPALAKQLEEGGHQQVTAGPGDATLLRWMNRRKRRLPKAFSWTVLPNRFDQVLAYWINLDSPNWKAPRRRIDVAVVDTEDEPNTIRIRAEGISTLSLFLSDDIVDLDRNVRVIVNDHIEYDDVLPLAQRMRAVGRDFDFLFNRDPVRIRTSMYFGWLSPARIVSLNVRPRSAQHTPAPLPIAATATDVLRAARLLQKARIFHAKGNKRRAMEQLEKLLKLPRTPSHRPAEDLLKELGK